MTTYEFNLSNVHKAVLILMFTVVSVFVSLSFGSVGISMFDSAACLFGQCSDPVQQMIIQDIRWPRVMMALLAGSGLALAGCLLQNATNNSLADPYLFGIVSGAGLGAILYNASGLNFGSIGISLAAFLGAALAMFIVLAVMMNNKLRKPEQLILTGVAVSFMLAAASQFFLYVSEPLAANRIIFWLMGSVAYAKMNSVYLVAIIVGLVSLLVYLMRHATDALLLGDDQAKSLGVPVDKVRLILLVMSSLLTAVIVAFCGGIGFVGLMMPHIARKLGANNMANLIPNVMILGGVFLVWVDLLARSSLENQEIPLGVITSALGSLFFLFILKRGNRD